MHNDAERFLEENGFFSWKEHTEEFRKKTREAISAAESGVYNMEYEKKMPRPAGGKILAIELGGTNLRLVLANFREKIEILKSTETKFFRENSYTTESLFEELWEHMEKFLGGDKVAKIAFVFSYPQKNDYRNGKIETTVIRMAKDIKVDGISGANITEEFSEFLKKKIGETEVVVINDATAGALMLNYIEDFEDRSLGGKINLIIGTGYNIAYVKEDGRRVKVVNTEAGTFPPPEYTKFDKRVNEKAGSSHIHHFESMMSGKWIPMLFREIVEGMGISAENVTDMKSMIEFAGSDAEMNSIIEAIKERGAYMAGTVLGEIINHLGKRKAAILAEGSVFWSFEDYKDRILGTIMNITDADVELVKRDNAASSGCIYLLTQLD